MSSIILDRRDIQLEYATDCLIVRCPDQPPRTLPLNRLKRLVCMHSVQLSTQLIGQLLKRGIDFVVVNQRYVEHGFSLFADHQRDATRRSCQYIWQNHPGIRAEWARQLVAHKLKVSLRIAQDNGNDLLSTRLDEIRHQVLACSEETSLRGLEGAAQQALFAWWRSLLPTELGFERRQRRPPPDPVNATLSLTYTMIHQEAVRQLKVVGLDPMLGMYHRIVSNRQALACDLMEPLRPHAERWVVGLFLDKVLDRRHFSRTSNGCLMGKEGRQRYYSAYEIIHKHWQKTLAGYARVLAKQVDQWAQSQQVLR